MLRAVQVCWVREGALCGRTAEHCRQGFLVRAPHPDLCEPLKAGTILQSSGVQHGVHHEVRFGGADDSTAEAAEVE